MIRVRGRRLALLVVVFVAASVVDAKGGDGSLGGFLYILLLAVHTVVAPIYFTLLVRECWIEGTGCGLDACSPVGLMPGAIIGSFFGAGIGAVVGAYRVSLLPPPYSEVEPTL